MGDDRPERVETLAQVLDALDDGAVAVGDNVPRGTVVTLEFPAAE